MKRIGNLYDQIISIDNLRLADEKARRGKTHSWGVKIHDKHREENLLRLHEDLKNHTFRTSEYETFKIYEPKERIIFRLPYFPDRIVHHAVMNIMEPIWVAIFTHDTYSCIKDRGIHQAADRIERQFYRKSDESILKRLFVKCQEILCNDVQIGE
jgi:retron-type reverse transcriptase